MGLIEDGYFDGNTVDSVGGHSPQCPPERGADSRSQDSMSGIEALPAHGAPVHLLSDASAAHRRSHTVGSSSVWDRTIQVILYEQS